jgi:uncharacterized protein
MDITPLIPKGRQVIEAYGDGGFRVSGQRYEGAIIVLPHDCIAWSFTGEPADFATLLSIREKWNVALLLLGTGASIRPVAKDVRMRLQQAGLSIEPMDTGAACRTYNVLIAEGRNVAAALIPIP